MGLRKLPMKLIVNEKKRNETYRKRKAGLIKKLDEFTILCDVKACMIVYGPKLGKCPVEVETWPGPEHIDQVHSIIERYRKIPEEDKQKRRQDLYDFFQDRKKKTEVDLDKLRKKHDEFQYFDHDQFNGLAVDQLQQVLQRLGSKMESLDERIQQKKNQDMMGMMSQYPNVAPVNETTYSMPNTSYDHGTMSRNIDHLLCRQQLGHAASSSHGDFYRQLFGGQGVSFDHHNQYKKRKTNDYHSCDTTPVMFNGAHTFALANVAYDPVMNPMENIDFGYPGSSTLNMMPIPWSGSMPSAGYTSQGHQYQPSAIMQQGSSSYYEHPHLFSMNSFPMSSGSALCQMRYPVEESFAVQDQVNKYKQQ